jgi:hypothetical protein
VGGHTTALATKGGKETWLCKLAMHGYHILLLLSSRISLEVSHIVPARNPKKEEGEETEGRE